MTVVGEVPRPQPIGVHDLPAGLLLVPDAPGADAVRAALLAGRSPETWPEALAAHRAALVGGLPAALDALDSLDPASPDPVVRYDRWVLDPAGDDPAAVREALPAVWAPLVDVVAYCCGLTDELPADAPDAPPELRAVVLATRAAGCVEGGDLRAAHVLLDRASAQAGRTSPVLAAVLRGESGGVLRRHGADPAAARRALLEALHVLDGTDLAATRAELHAELGGLAHEGALASGGSLDDAVAHYYAGLALVTEAGAPSLWAGLQLNLASVHLVAPMSDGGGRLRLGVAAQALRACRRVFTPASHPGPWATATLDLANVLVYGPSAHRDEWLHEAVGLYEEVLASGVRDDDPRARARVLANLGNALAHLGVLGDARARLVEARSVFEEHLDHDGALAVREVLDAVARREVPDPAGAGSRLARRTAQMDRVPTGSAGPRTAGMGVRVEPPAEAQRRATVTVLPAAVDPGEGRAPDRGSP